MLLNMVLAYLTTFVVQKTCFGASYNSLSAYFFQINWEISTTFYYDLKTFNKFHHISTDFLQQLKRFTVDDCLFCSITQTSLFFDP